MSRGACSAAIRVVCVIWCASASTAVLAQSASAYPSKVIRLVVPYTPGASNDTLSRATGESMSPILGQPIIIDNRPGAGGMIGAEHVARGGHVQMVITSLPSALVLVKAGRLKALGVAADKRSSFALEIPTVKEGGIAYVSELWWGLAAPGKTPTEIVDKLSDTLRKAMQSAQLKQRYATKGAEAVPMSPQEFTKYVHDEITRWRRVVKDAGLTLE